MGKASRGLHSLLAVSSDATSQRRPERHSASQAIASLECSLNCFLTPECCCTTALSHNRQRLLLQTSTDERMVAPPARGVVSKRKAGSALLECALAQRCT